MVVSLLAEYVPVLTHEEGQEQHLKDKPGNFDNISDEYLLLQKHMVLVNVFPSLLILEVLLLAVLDVFVDDRDEHAVAHIMGQTSDSHGLDYP